MKFARKVDWDLNLWITLENNSKIHLMKIFLWNSFDNFTTFPWIFSIKIKSWPNFFSCNYLLLNAVRSGITELHFDFAIWFINVYPRK